MRKLASLLAPYPLRALVVLGCFMFLWGCPRAYAAAVATNNFRFLDLAPFAIDSDALSERQFSAVPKGLQSFHGGVPFLVRAPMGLNGMESARAGEHSSLLLAR